MELIVILGVYILLMVWANKMAKDYNRDTTSWVIATFFFGIFAIIALAIAGRKEKV